MIPLVDAEFDRDANDAQQRQDRQRNTGEKLARAAKSEQQNYHQQRRDNRHCKTRFAVENEEGRALEKEQGRSTGRDFGHTRRDIDGRWGHDNRQGVEIYRQYKNERLANK